jgi:hypothetical protein
MEPATGALRAWVLDGNGFIEVTDLGEVGPGQRVVGNADYDGDGYADLLLHDPETGEVELRFLVGGHLAETALLSAAPGWRVVSSPLLPGDAGASILVADPPSGRIEKLALDGTSEPLTPFPIFARFASRFVAGLDADGDGFPTVFYETSGALIGHTPTGPRAGMTQAGPVTIGNLEFVGACDRAGAREDVVIASEPGIGLHRVVLGNPDQTLRIEAIEGLGPAAATLPVVAVGDWNTDGHCDVALEFQDSLIIMIVLHENDAYGGWGLPTPGPSWVPVGVGDEVPAARP